MAIRIGITSLGCAKNLVDSEVILGYLERDGIEVCDDPNGADVIIVNTCCFIAEAEQESDRTIGDLLSLKERGEIGRVVVAGCLPARRGTRLCERFPGVDYFLSPHEIPRVAPIVRGLLSHGSGGAGIRGRGAARNGWFLYDHRSPRVRLSPPHYAYLKIGEGCDNRCSYCLIPSIKGPLTSREEDSVVEEARALAAGGAREINLVSQDTTSFGSDRGGGGSALARLLERLCGVEGIGWIRLLYGNPARYDEDLLRLIDREPAICRYVDFPLQHVSDRILAAMNRPMTKSTITERLAMVRDLVPGVSVRTTIIVGFPGETEEDFEELLDFVREARFEHLGAFTYSREEGTPAAAAPGQVHPEVAEDRFHLLMTAQQEVVAEANEKTLGRRMRILVDERLDEGDFALRGRGEGDAPEVDGGVYVTAGDELPGDFMDVRVTGVMDYDLVGSPCGSHSGRPEGGEGAA